MSRSVSKAALMVSLMLAACGQGGHRGEDPLPLVQSVTSGPVAQRLGDEFAKHYQESEGLTYAQLREAHEVDYLDKLGFQVSDAAHYAGFVESFSLAKGATKKLDELGFVVVPSPAREPTSEGSPGAGPADIYYRVFAADLPVFVSADSLLHAWHRSFDKLLETTETALMIPALADLLDQTMASLDDGEQDQRDALLYLSVARALLEPSWKAPERVSKDTARFVELAEARRLVPTEFLGTETRIDFSQFIPRGHYTRSEDLSRYFKSMMWLGRTDLVLYDPDPSSPPRPREEAAARALAGAMQIAKATPHFELMDRIYGAYVGRTNALTPVALLELCAAAGLEHCRGAVGTMEPLYAKQDPPEYSSRVFASDVPPIAMRFFPQRFGYGAWITTQTTTPRLEPAVQGGRSMAMPEDVAFALGSNRALEYFAADMERPLRDNLPATLQAARLTMDAIPPAEIGSTAQNQWLEALRALSSPSVDKTLPQVMRTAAWHDRKLEAVLASWAELRHDTILIVEQSTGGVGCQYPKGYVEPVPALYRSLALSAAALAEAYATLPLPSILASAVPFFAEFQTTMERLAGLAEKQLASLPMDADDLVFLNRTVDNHGLGYAGARSYNGWYPLLFWYPGWNLENLDDFAFEDHPSGISEPIVADVHTDAERELALEVAVGHPGLMIIAVDNDGDLSLYGGPVSSYYSFHAPLDQRVTDEQWNERLAQGQAPDRPPFAATYWVE